MSDVIFVWLVIYEKLRCGEDDYFDLRSNTNTVLTFGNLNHIYKRAGVFRMQYDTSWYSCCSIYLVFSYYIALYIFQWSNITTYVMKMIWKRETSYSHRTI